MTEQGGSESRKLRATISVTVVVLDAVGADVAEHRWIDSVGVAVEHRLRDAVKHGRQASFGPEPRFELPSEQLPEFCLFIRREVPDSRFAVGEQLLRSPVRSMTDLTIPTGDSTVVVSATTRRSSPS